MLNTDYNKQFEKRQRIKRTTLVTKTDMGADFNALVFMNEDGNVLGGFQRWIIPGKGSISYQE